MRRKLGLGSIDRQLRDMFLLLMMKKDYHLVCDVAEICCTYAQLEARILFSNAPTVVYMVRIFQMTEHLLAF